MRKDNAMSNPDFERISKSLDEINERLNRLKGVEEILPSATNQQAQRVFNKTYKLIAAMIGIWIIPAGILLTLLGIKSLEIEDYVKDAENAAKSAKEAEKQTFMSYFEAEKAVISTKKAENQANQTLNSVQEIQKRIEEEAKGINAVLKDVGDEKTEV